MARETQSEASPWYRDSRFLIENVIAHATAAAAFMAVFKVGSVTVQLERLSKIQVQTKVERELDGLDQYLAQTREGVGERLQLICSPFSFRGMGESSVLADSLTKAATAIVDSIDARWLAVQRTYEDAVLEFEPEVDSLAVARSFPRQRARVEELGRQKDSAKAEIRSTAADILRSRGLEEPQHER